MPKVAPGRIVLFVLGVDPVGREVLRPALVIRCIEDRVNLQVFTDGPVDDRYLEPFERASTLTSASERATASTVHRQLVAFDERRAEGTWHLLPKEGA